MEHYVTLFDSLFLPQGLALHASMERHADDYTLWVLCMDNDAYEVLTRMGLPRIRLLLLGDLETPELLAVKPGRTRGEYCWTLTPFAPRFVFEADNSVQRVTYLDADIWFRKSPALLLDELDRAGKAVLITDHGYAPEHDSTATSGQYCVQFICFERDRGETVRKWWEARCVEWCFARYEPGRFGDQKYLDDWPERFPDTVHVLERQDRMLAPWNVTRFPFGGAVAYHFQGLRLLANSRVLLAPKYALPPFVVEHVYRPYLQDLKNALRSLATADWHAPKQAIPPGWWVSLRPLAGLIRRNLWRIRLHRILSL